MNPSGSIYTDLVAINYIKGLQYRYIWKRRWGIVKVLYLYSRYSTFVDTIIAILERFDPDITNCSRVMTFTTIFAGSGISLTEIILMIRTYAIYSSSKRVLIFFFLLWMPLSGISIWAAIKWTGSSDDDIIVLMTAYKGFSVWRNAFTLLSVLGPVYLPYGLSYAETLLRVMHTVLTCHLILRVRHIADEKENLSNLSSLRCSDKVVASAARISVIDILVELFNMADWDGPRPAFSLLDLPNEIIVEVLTNLELDDVASFAITNRRMNGVAGTHILDFIGLDSTDNRLRLGQEECPFVVCTTLPKLLDWIPSPKIVLDCYFGADLCEEIDFLLSLLAHLPVIDTFTFNSKAIDGREDHWQETNPIDEEDFVDFSANRALDKILRALSLKGCKTVSFLDQTLVPVSQNADSTSIPELSTVKNMTCFSPWVLSTPAYQKWFVNSCNESKIHSLSLVFVPQVAQILHLIHIPLDLKEVQLTFGAFSPPKPRLRRRQIVASNVSVQDEAQNVPGHARILADRGLSDFIVRHPRITQLDLGMVSELFITNRICKPLPSMVLPSLKTLSASIKFLPYMIPTPDSLPALEEVEVYITATFSHEDSISRETLYGAGLRVLSAHNGHIKSLRLFLYARVRSMLSFSRFFTFRDITLSTIEKITIT
ncbi:hypothetical protein K435DRAFT_845151, partial [Dendrothele bispora CBS 962.96]